MDNPILMFEHGVENFLRDEIINPDAAQDEQNWITQDGRLKLAYGRINIGAEGTVGKVSGLWKGYKVDGSIILWRKIKTAIQYFDGSVWQNVITALTADADYSFAPYSSTAGAFSFFSGVDGLYKVNNANPGSYISMYKKGTNDKGNILIDKGRMLMWNNVDASKVSLRISNIDIQTTPYYQQITNEILGTGDGSTQTFAGNLSAAQIAYANMFGLVINAPTGSAKNITAITQAINAQLTVSSHGYTVGDTILISGLGPANGNNTGTGTISYAGAGYAVTGSGTAFTTQLKVGAIIQVVGGFFGVVTSIVDDTHLTISNDSGVVISGQAFVYTNMGQLTGVAAKVASVVDANNFTINIDSSNYNVYTSGGTVSKTETFTDFNGILTGNNGGTGTINYITGAFSLTTNVAPANAANIVCTYLWENSNDGGITDFTSSASRTAGQGGIITQDIGGDAIQSVEIGQDGNYYSFKLQSVYQLIIPADDLLPESTVYRSNIGIPSQNASVSVKQGIVFMNTSNPDKPEMTVLQRTVVGSDIEPIILFPQFKFGNYDYSDCFMATYERYIILSCKKAGSILNDTILLCDMSQKTVDIISYNARQIVSDNTNLYIGSPISQSVYQLFNGFDDMTLPIQNYWISRGEQYTNLKLRQQKWRFIGDELKRFRRLRFLGLIAPNQEFEVYVSFDDAEFQLVGTVLGSGSYVDFTNAQEIGANMVGQVQIGGQDISVAYPFMVELKVKCPKFRKRTVKIVATGIGYLEIGRMMDWDILLFEDKIPKRFRQKQHVSLDGTKDDQDYFNS